MAREARTVRSSEIDGMRWNSMEVANAGTAFYFSDPNGPPKRKIAIQLGCNSASSSWAAVQ